MGPDRLLVPITNRSWYTFVMSQKKLDYHAWPYPVAVYVHAYHNSGADNGKAVEAAINLCEMLLRFFAFVGYADVMGAGVELGDMRKPIDKSSMGYFLWLLKQVAGLSAPRSRFMPEALKLCSGEFEHAANAINKIRNDLSHPFERPEGAKAKELRNKLEPHVECLLEQCGFLENYRLQVAGKCERRRNQLPKWDWLVFEGASLLMRREEHRVNEELKLYKDDVCLLSTNGCGLRLDPLFFWGCVPDFGKSKSVKPENDTKETLWYYNGHQPDNGGHSFEPLHGHFKKTVVPTIEGTLLSTPEKWPPAWNFGEGARWTPKPVSTGETPDLHQVKQWVEDERRATEHTDEMREFGLGYLLGCYSLENATQTQVLQPKDALIGFSYLYRASQMEHGYWAKLEIGARLFHGDEIQADKAEGLRWIEDAAEQAEETGDPYFMWAFGEALVDGDKRDFPVPKDLERGVKLLESAAATGEPCGAHELAKRFLNAKGPISDPHKALEWLREAAKSGDVKVIQELGERLIKGDGVPPDSKEGHMWLEKAGQPLH